jgi:pimeloyl-ACP methyl ester carboxylesterase
VIVTIVISAFLLVAVAEAVFIAIRYLPIIANLFMNITVRPEAGEPERLEGEDVVFETSDGQRLVGTLTGSGGAGARGARTAGAADDAARGAVIVFCHEFGADRHSAAKNAGFLGEAGFRVFAFDFRGHGDSERPPGYSPRPWVTEHEVSDLKAALAYLSGRADTQESWIGLFGVSRGASTAIVVGADEPSVHGIVSDGGFSTSHTLHNYMRRWSPIFLDPILLFLSRPDWVLSVFRRLAMKLAEHRMGVRCVSVERALRRLEVPILFVHGEQDSYIEMNQAKMLLGFAGGPKEIWMVPKADHNESMDVAPAEYSRRVVEFFRTALGENQSRRTGEQVNRR